jgi:hypothetical protein
MPSLLSPGCVTTFTSGENGFTNVRQLRFMGFKALDDVACARGSIAAESGHIFMTTPPSAQATYPHGLQKIPAGGREVVFVLP